MGGTCYYCGKYGTHRAQAIATGQPHWLCDNHADSALKVQNGRNAGFQAGIA